MSSLVSVVIDTSISVRNYTTKASSESIYIDADDVAEIRKVSDNQSLVTLLDGKQYTVNQALAPTAAETTPSYTGAISAHSIVSLTIYEGVPIP